MQSLAVVLQIIICISLIVLILIQHGKGADAGATFGGGASNTVFGSKGSNSFLIKVTTWVAIAFFANCLYMGALSKSDNKSLMVKSVGSASEIKTGNVVTTSPSVGD